MIGETSALIEAIASTDLRAAAPIAVPRAVVKLSIASISCFLSVVGGTTSSAKPENATRPIRTPDGCFSTNERAAAWATVSLFGLTSVEHIDPETSNARITEVRLSGTAIIALGRALAMQRPASPTRKSATGRCRRQRERVDIAARISATLEYRTATRRLRRNCHK